MPIDEYPTVEEQRAFVLEYLAAPYGTKGQFLAASGVRPRTLGRWRAQVFADTLDRGLVPRSVAVRMGDVAAFRRLLEENQALREELAARQAQHEAELAVQEGELARQRRAVDALGKAIELLHPDGASKNSEPPVQDAPTKDLLPRSTPQSQ